MQEIYRGEFYSYQGVKNRVSIYDLDPPLQKKWQDITLNSPGYELQYTSNINNTVKGGILESELYIYVENVDDILGSFLENIVLEENRYLIKIYRGTDLFWFGIVMQDFSGMADLPQGTVKIGAVDGLGILKSIEADDYISGIKESFLEYILEGLGHLETTDFFSDTDDFCHARTDWYSYNMDTTKEPLDQCTAADDNNNFLWQEISTRKGWNGSDVKEEKNKSWYDIIENIMIHFNSVLLLNEGKWYIVQRALLQDNNTLSYKTFDRLGRYIVAGGAENTNIEIDQSTNGIYRAEGQFSFMPGLSYVECTYLAAWQNAYGISSLIPSTFGLGDTIQTILLLTGAGNYIDFRLTFDDKYDVSAITLNEWQAYTRYTLEVKLIGASTYYLQDDGTTWDLAADTITIQSDNCLGKLLNNSTIPPSLYQDRDSTFTSWQRYTDDLPINGYIELNIIRKDIIAHPSYPQITPLLSGITADTFTMNPTATYLIYIYNNTAPVDYAYFKAVNQTSGFTLGLTLQDSLFGSQGQATKGILQILNGATWEPSITLNSKKWNKGSASTKDKYFIELLVREVLANQDKPLLFYSGRIYDRNDSGITFTPIQSIQMDYDGYEYRLHLNNIRYTPQDDC